MTQIFLLIIFIIFFVSLAWRKTVWALALIIFALPSYLIRFEIFNFPMTLLEIMILTLFAVFCVKQVSGLDKCFFEKIRLKNLEFSNYKVFILAILIIATLAAIYSDNTRGAWGVWKAYFFEPILFFVVFINTVKTKKDFLLIINSLGVSALVVSAFAIFQKITGAFIFNEFWYQESSRRVTSFFGYPNAVGLYLAPIIILFCGKCWLETKNYLQRISQKKKHFFLKMVSFFSDNKALGKNTVKEIMVLIFNLAVVVTGGLAVFFARCEGALIALIVGAFFLGLLFKSWRKLTIGVLIIFILSTVFVPTINTYFTEKIMFMDFSGNLRLIIWQETWQMLNDNVLWGGGLANYQMAIKSYHHAFEIFEIYLYPHNLILNFWTELGVLGVLFFLFLILKFFFNYFKAQNQEWYKIFLATITVMLVHGLVDVIYFKNDLSVFWWLLFACSWFFIKQKSKLEEK